jgi:hypothetical protein
MRAALGRAAAWALVAMVLAGIAIVALAEMLAQPRKRRGIE